MWSVARSWLLRPLGIALAVPLVLGGAYGGTWLVTGEAPLSADGPCPGTSPAVAPVDGGGEPAAPDASQPSDAPDPGARLTLTADVSPHPAPATGAVTFTLTVTNTGDGAATLTFGTSQDGDVALLADGVERYRWSDGRTFTAATRTIEVPAGGSRSFTLEATLALDPGTYDLVATLASEPAPRPDVRSVQLGDAPSPAASQPSETPSRSAEPEPSAPIDPSSDPSPEPEPAPPSTTPPASPQPTQSTRGIAPAARARPRTRGARRRGARRRAGLLTLLLLIAPPATAQLLEGGSGGRNVVAVVNETDGALRGRAAVRLGSAHGQTAAPENLALARASCTDCRTIAVAFQVVTIVGSPAIIAPRNAAAAINVGCSGCETIAYAWQYVLSTGAAVRLTDAGRDAVASIDARARELVTSPGALTGLIASLDALAAELRATIDTHTVPRPGGRAGRDVDVARAPRC